MIPNPVALFTLGLLGLPETGEPEMTLTGDVHGIALLTTTPGRERSLVVARPDALHRVHWWEGSASRGELPRGEARAMAWCVAGDPAGQQRVYALDETGVLRSWDGRSDPREVLRARGVILPDGVFPMRFADDFDLDGEVDFALPSPDGFQLYFGVAGGAPRLGPAVRHEIDVDIGLDSVARSDPRFVQDLNIPAFRVEDQNGDGHPDLVFRDDDRVQFYWSGRDGKIPAEATFGLDLEEIRSQLPQRSRGIIDPGNLLTLLESQVTHLTRDFDGDGVADLLLRRGSKVSVYRGTAGQIDRSRATQVLRTAGNLLAAYALDDDGDGRDDLGLLLVSDISIGQILVWLVAGTSLSFDLFVYRQEDALRFSRKPTRVRRLTIDIPSLLSLSDEIGDHIDDLATGLTRVPVAADLDGDGRRDDVVSLGDDAVIRFHLDADQRAEIVEFASGWYDVVARFDDESDGREDVKVGLYDLVDWVPVPGRHLRRSIDGRDPAWMRELPDAAEGDAMALFVVDLNGDGVDDVVAGWGEEKVTLRFFATER